MEPSTKALLIPFSWPTLWGRRPHNTVFPTTQQGWRRTSSSTEASDDDSQTDLPELVDAAFFLLEDTTLAGATPSLEQRPPAMATHWDEVMANCIAPRLPKAAASSKLLAMRNAVPSPSARMVFQSQVGNKHANVYVIMTAFADAQVHLHRRRQVYRCK